MADFLSQRLEKLREKGTYRTLPGTVEGVDFWSNDYLGLTRIEAQEQRMIPGKGATGSRLISGDRDEISQLEQQGISKFHGFPAALFYNSGYTALLGLLSAVLRRTDTIIYDELSHACCRDGIRLGHAKSQRFNHNDTLHLRQRLSKVSTEGQIFVLTEGRFSMDGDVAPLTEILDICNEFGAHLIVDEAHSGGIDGLAGEGLIASLGLQKKVFATVITYGKAFGAHGAAVLGNETLRQYLINTSRPFIYTTGLAASQLAEIAHAYKRMAHHHSQQIERLRYNILFFQQLFGPTRARDLVSRNDGPIQTVSVPGNHRVMQVESACLEAGLLVKGIRSPTVAAGTERLRICLHSFNTSHEIERLAAVLRSTIPNFARS